MKLGLTVVVALASVSGSPLAAASDEAQSPAVIWATPTNHWPDALWVYGVARQQFPPAVLSNLLALAGFSEKDRSQPPAYLAETDQETVFYGDIEGTSKYLAICPLLGYIAYHDGAAKASSQLQKVAGVPGEGEATRLGLEWVRRLGIDTSLLATKPGNAELDLRWRKGTMTYLDQQTKTEITVTNSYGVLFPRRVDGIRVHGFGGVDITFGNDSRIADLALCWRNLQAQELRRCASPQQVAAHLRTGKVGLHPLGSRDAYPLHHVGELTITRITFLYEGKPPEERMEFVHPYLNFEAIAGDGQTSITVWFECPIEASALMPPPPK